jgi:transcription elongation factor Elf1
MPRSLGSSSSRTRRQTGQTREARCPACSQPVICAEVDAAFESYRIDCGVCETPLEGIVDPFDETLLLSIRNEL